MLAIASISVAFAPLSGISLPRASDASATVDLGALSGAKTLVVFGTYPADFNMIEYAQKLRHYQDALRAKGIERFVCIANGKPESCTSLADILSLPDDVELLADESGAAGRAFGVSTGWLADNADVSPYAKLFGMLLGLGAGNTLPSVITGYLGNPYGEAGWIQSSLDQGSGAGRWPAVPGDEFENLPVVGSWGRRPLELATLRLQNMIGISIANWQQLQPSDDRCLTQLGGLLAVDADGRPLYQWRDNGICATADFEALLRAL
jgi:peroxiredoxin